jgi:hypothetical protein
LIPVAEVTQCVKTASLFQNEWAHIEEMRTLYVVLVRELEGKKPLGGTGHRSEDNIKMDLMEISLDGVHWVHLTQFKNHWQPLVDHLSDCQLLKMVAVASSLLVDVPKFFMCNRDTFLSNTFMRLVKF